VTRRLPAIELAINLARSQSTGYLPLFLDTGRLPWTMIRDAPSKDEYPHVRVYVQRMKLALWNTHDALLSARLNQMIQVNRERCICPFIKGGLVYIFTKNINFNKGISLKFVPKFIRPYRIELPDSLKREVFAKCFSLLSLLRPEASARP